MKLLIAASEPLVVRGSSSMTPIPDLRLDREISSILSSLPSGWRYTYHLPTPRSLSALRENVDVLHCCGHGVDGFWMLERGGEAVGCGGEMLERGIGIGCVWGVVVLSFCHSSSLAEVFRRLGAKSVVSVKRGCEVRDEASEIFSAAFYGRLGRDGNVKGAVEAGNAAVAAELGEEEACYEWQGEEKVVGRMENDGSWGLGEEEGVVGWRRVEGVPEGLRNMLFDPLVGIRGVEEFELYRAVLECVRNGGEGVVVVGGEGGVRRVGRRTTTALFLARAFSRQKECPLQRVEYIDEGKKWVVEWSSAEMKSGERSEGGGEEVRSEGGGGVPLRSDSSSTPITLRILHTLSPTRDHIMSAFSSHIILILLAPTPPAPLLTSLPAHLARRCFCLSIPLFSPLDTARLFLAHTQAHLRSTSSSTHHLRASHFNISTHSLRTSHPSLAPYQAFLHHLSTQRQLLATKGHPDAISVLARQAAHLLQRSPPSPSALPSTKDTQLLLEPILFRRHVTKGDEKEVVGKEGMPASASSSSSSTSSSTSSTSSNSTTSSSPPPSHSLSGSGRRLEEALVVGVRMMGALEVKSALAVCPAVLEATCEGFRERPLSSEAMEKVVCGEWVVEAVRKPEVWARKVVMLAQTLKRATPLWENGTIGEFNQTHSHAKPYTLRLSASKPHAIVVMTAHNPPFLVLHDGETWTLRDSGGKTHRNKDIHTLIRSIL